MAHAVNYDVYKSMDALEAARAIDPGPLLGAAEVRGAALPASRAAQGRARRRSRRSSSRANPWQLSVARKQLQEIRKAESREHAELRVAGSLVRSSLVFAAIVDGAHRAGVLAMNWRLFVGASILVVALMFKVGRAAGRHRAAASRWRRFSAG